MRATGPCVHALAATLYRGLALMASLNAANHGALGNTCISLPSPDRPRLGLSLGALAGCVVHEFFHFRTHTLCERSIDAHLFERLRNGLLRSGVRVCAEEGLCFLVSASPLQLSHRFDDPPKEHGCTRQALDHRRPRPQEPMPGRL